MLDAWDKKIHSDRLRTKYSGCWCRFESTDHVLHESTDDLDGSASDIRADTPCILTSCTKVFAGTAVMRTMQLKPDDWYPEKGMHEFRGWSQWKNFPVYDNVSTTDGIPGWSGQTAEKITIHQLLTHTCGWPFGLQGSRKTILNMPLYYHPGTGFGYTIGHRILGWMLLDYWKLNQPEGRTFENLNDVFSYLVYEPLGMTSTYFIQDKFDGAHSIMGEFFSMKYFDNPDHTCDDNPADLALASTGNDMMKLCMMALRRGRLPDGSVYIAKWDEWAATNQLPGNKFTAVLADWRLEGYDDVNFIWRTAVTRIVNAGSYGWSYFGATYHDCPDDCTGDVGIPIAVGWKGFSSCGLRADYAQRVSFVVMQECVPDPKNRNFAELLRTGMIGSRFKMGDVARKLAEIGHSDLEERRQRYTKSCRCCHDVMAEIQPNHCVRMGQCFIRCLYRCALPLGVKMLKFHKYERLAEKALHGSSNAVGNSNDSLLPWNTYSTEAVNARASRQQGSRSG